VWSLGCILYEIAFGRLPFGHINSTGGKCVAILKGRVEYPRISQGDVLDVLKRCLVRDQDKRADIDELLGHQYLKTVAAGVVSVSSASCPLLSAKVPRSCQSGELLICCISLGACCCRFRSRQCGTFGCHLLLMLGAQRSRRMRCVDACKKHATPARHCLQSHWFLLISMHKRPLSTQQCAKLSKP
jgi:serine/threonine protein kinase